MTDDLRTRIAAVLSDALVADDSIVNMQYGSGSTSQIVVNCNPLADAVIRELNLDISHYYKTSQGREVCIEGFWTEEVADGTA